MIPAHHHVDCRMKLNTGNLRTAQLLHVINMMNMVILNQTEDTAHTTYDTGLLTTVNMTTSYDMSADVFL